MDQEPPPPVPALPESVNMAAARARGGAKPKRLPLVSTPVKTASQRMAEQQAKESGGAWFGGAKVGDLGSIRTNDAIMSTPSPAKTTTVMSKQAQQTPRTSHDSANGERPESRGSSVNFSYPARVRVASPTGVDHPQFLEEGHGAPATPERQTKAKRRSSTISPQRGRGGLARPTRASSIGTVSQDQTLVYDPNSRRMVPRMNLLALEHEIHTAAEKKPKKKKSAVSRAGSHLAKGTMGRSHGTAVDSTAPHEPHNEATMAAAASLRSHRTEDQQRQQRQPDVPESEDEDNDPSFEAAPGPEGTQREVVVEPQRVSPPHASITPEPLSSPTRSAHDGGLHRRPSTVREEEQESDLESDLESEIPQNASAALDAVPVRHSIYAHGVPSPPQSEITDDQPIESHASAPVGLAAAAIISPKTMPTSPERLTTSELRETRASQRGLRNQSKSPVRSARFGAVQEAPTVKHEPPARSLSPRKSALKQSSPSRGASPRGDRSESSGVDTPTQEPPVQRKKSVRVSFDDENTVVVGEAAGAGEALSPVPPSPQQMTGPGRKPWYSSLGIGKKKDAVPLEEDEVMKPRPALPSFGSVRERKQSPKPAEERPLVRPYEPPAETEKTSEVDAMGHSSDHAVGALFQEQASRNGANISKVREPLPPVVTSIEGSGYASDSVESSDDDAALLADTPKLETQESQVSQASTLVPEQWKALNGSAAAATTSEQSGIDVDDLSGAPSGKSDTVPVISITHPSPRPEQKGEEARTSYMHFPGEFPETETETDGEQTPARKVTFEPVVQQEDATATQQTPGTVLATQPAVQDSTDDSDGNSIYSDAYEDLAEIEGDGFQSLDAVVEKPMLSTPPKNILERAEAQRAGASTPTPLPRTESTGTPPHESATTDPDDPWAAAKAYWRSLTAEKRSQLEKEAVEEAGTEADLEGAQSGVKKPRKKKSLEQKNAEKKVLEEQRASADPNRAYMIKPGTKAGPLGDDPIPTAIESGQPIASGTKADKGMRLRKTLRAAEVQPVDTGTHMRRSMRADAPERPAVKQRRASHQPSGSAVEGNGGRSKSGSVPPAGQSINHSMTQPSLRRRGSDSSESSFRRARPASTGFGFRRTMRTGAGSLDLQEQSERSQPKRFSLRGTSPSAGGASPPVSMGTRMRTTLRGDASARRGSEDSGKGYLRFSGSLGRTPDKKGKQRSRFGDDSSDEEDVTVPRHFASRFEDSSDDDVVPSELPSVQSMTRRQSKGQSVPSPPLPEEEEMSDVDGAEGDEKSHEVTTGAAPDSSLRRSRSGRGVDGGRPSSRRSGFMASVLGRNKKHDGVSKISRSNVTESAARRDTNLERSADELAALRSSTPRLHKRVASMPASSSAGSSSGNWPLDDDHKQPLETERPATSAGGGGRATPGTTTTTMTRFGNKDELDAVDEEEGVDEAAAAMRSPSVLAHAKSQPSMGKPAFLMRRTMSAMDDAGASEAGDGRGKKKKKKFGVLRRMLKLDD